jgi:PEP-CTERM motif
VISKGKTMKFKALISAACMFFITGIVEAAPVVTFTTGGSAGSWQADFSITNTLGGTNNIYMWGVQAPTNHIAGTPNFWTAYTITNWTNSGNGGSSILYNNVWATSIGATSKYAILPGQTGSFSVVYDSVVAPTSVAWFAYAAGGNYTGTDFFGNASYPGFEGVATVPGAVPVVTPVPEPKTYAMLLVGLGLLGFTARRRKDNFI